MRPLLPLLLLSLLACQKAPVDDDDDYSDVDLYGSDGGGGSDGADSGDGADGSDGSDGSDGGDDLLSGCTDADLRPELHAIDAHGRCEACDVSEAIQLLAAVVNPCDSALVFTTRTGCLWGSMEIVTPRGEGMGMGGFCDTAITDWEIGAGDTLSELLWEDRMESGSWWASVRF